MNELYKYNEFTHIIILGSCLALNLSYNGCCMSSLSPSCSNNGCYCDLICHTYGDCCSDVANIGCHPAPPLSPILTPTDALGKTN